MFVASKSTTTKLKKSSARATSRADELMPIDNLLRRRPPDGGRTAPGCGGKFRPPLRPNLTRVAYRMLGSVADAEDVLQEAFIRWMGPTAARCGSPRRSCAARRQRISPH